jgi:hypothetical protein
MIDWKRFKELLADNKLVVAFAVVAIVVIWMLGMRRLRLTGTETE